MQRSPIAGRGSNHATKDQRVVAGIESGRARDDDVGRRIGEDRLGGGAARSSCGRVDADDDRVDLRQIVHRPRADARSDDEHRSAPSFVERIDGVGARRAGGGNPPTITRRLRDSLSLVRLHVG